MAGYYYNDGTRIYFIGEKARVLVALPDGTLVTVSERPDAVLESEYVIEDILDAEVIG